MKNKLLFIILGSTLVLVTLILVGYKIISASKVVSPLSEAPTPTVTEDLATWTDPAEFSFQYPKTLKVDPHNEDQENYAHVELKSDQYKGNLIVWVKDTASETIDDWVKMDKVQGAIDSTLGDESAKKALTAKEPITLTISTIRNGYLYQVEASLQDDYWIKVFDKVVSTFKFTSSEEKPSTGESTSSDEDTGGADIYEEEEVIE